MNKAIIIKASKQYEELMIPRKELQKARNLLLAKDLSEEKRKECLEIIEKEEAKLPSEEGIIKYSFHSVIDDGSECNIYVFIGAFRKVKEQTLRIDDYTKADFFVYQNLEKQFSGVVIYPEEQKQFEIDNIVLRFSDYSSNVIKKFEKLQCAYYSEYLNNEDISQDKVLKKIKENL